MKGPSSETGRKVVGKFTPVRSRGNACGKDGYSSKPDKWRSKLASKQSAYSKFYVAFGSAEIISPTKNRFLSGAAIDTSELEEINTRREVENFSKKKKKKNDVGSEDAIDSKKLQEGCDWQKSMDC